MKRIGKYEQIKPLGQGGSASVYSGYDPLMGRPVAIKFLTDCADDKELARLRAEARAAGGLQHRNVVSIFGLEMEGDHPFLVMELLEGCDLSALIASGTPIPLRQAVEIMYQVAQGLDHAHSNGVVHRDVSPQNIWITRDGTAKLIDFGIAGRVQAGRTLTDTDCPLGTVLFFSPEHLADSRAELDPRSDVFSYGSVFYELIAGRHPFAGGDDRETICNILMHEPEQLSVRRPDCPAPLAQLIHRAIVKDLDLRYPSFRELIADLVPVLLDLRRPESDELFVRALLAFDDDLEEAKAALVRLFELTPDRKDARQLMDRLKTREREVAMRSKFDALLEEARQKCADRRFREAVSILEKAERLSPDSVVVVQLLKETRTKWEWHERCSALLREATEYRRAGKLEEACAAAAAAAAADPSHPEASRLAATLVVEERDGSISEGIANARRLLQEAQFSTAESILQALLERYPGAARVQLLLTYTKGEVAARERKQVVENARREAIRLAAFGEYAQALAVINGALQQYPDDPDLTRLREATRANLGVQEER